MPNEKRKKKDIKEYKPQSNFWNDTVSVRLEYDGKDFLATARTHDEARELAYADLRDYINSRKPAVTRITEEYLKSEIADVKYTRVTDTMTHCAITVHNGFVFTGESSCVSAANYDETIGREIAYANAFREMWAPYGFALKQKMYEGEK